MLIKKLMMILIIGVLMCSCSPKAEPAVTEPDTSKDVVAEEPVEPVAEEPIAEVQEPELLPEPEPEPNYNMNTKGDMLMDVLALIVPVITFALGYCLSNKAFNEQSRRDRIKELFINFYIPFLAPSFRLVEQEYNTYSNFSKYEKENTWNLLDDYEFLLSHKLQESIYSFRMTCNVNSDSVFIDAAWEVLVAEIISEYKKSATTLNYPISNRC